MYIFKLHKTIVLSSCLLGSIYMFSKSLEMMNNSLLEDKKIPNALIAINSLTFLFSGYIVVQHCIYSLYIVSN
jgi:hypothetical protein